MADLHSYMTNWNYKMARDPALDDTKFLLHADDCPSSTHHLSEVRGMDAAQ